jgi:hypothetical protein
MAGQGGNGPFTPVKKLSKGVPDRARCQNKSGAYLLTFYGKFHERSRVFGPFRQIYSGQIQQREQTKSLSLYVVETRFHAQHAAVPPLPPVVL